MDNKGNIVIYKTTDGETSIDVKLENETVWINRQQMAELFDRDIKTIGKHINNALKEELQKIPVVAKFATTQQEGEREVTLVALTLMIAESRTEEKDLMVKVVINLINQNN